MTLHPELLFYIHLYVVMAWLKVEFSVIFLLNVSIDSIWHGHFSWISLSILTHCQDDWYWEPRELSLLVDSVKHFSILYRKTIHRILLFLWNHTPYYFIYSFDKNNKYDSLINLSQLDGYQTSAKNREIEKKSNFKKD